ncbi:AAA family ATPase [Kosmotoga pacifica]|uniref:Protein CR006 P-loop domain-containing protein n=1 Tax=Kosmotoga pacifica TaxID=1330330 RepID=A0A0G2ZAC5_9BACT|nr:AAA family ATPase [Kosmotoga pacifica]AKI97036.1 hypothetical protein IX53_03465 [Kosmotoga pacifica]
MIKRIIKIRNIAVFKNFNGEKIPEFGKYNIFYGWNGSGKTTITRILSAFEKCELGNLKLEDDSTCIIETDNGELRLSKSEVISDVLKNNIRVFNEDFVDENLDWKSGKASKILIIGKEHLQQKKELEETIESLNEKRITLNKKQKEFQAKVRKKDKILKEARDEVKEELRFIGDVKPKSGHARDYINYTVRDVEKILTNEKIHLLTSEEFLRLKTSLSEKEAKELISVVKINLEWLDQVKENSKEIFETVIPKEGVSLLLDLQADEELKEWLRVGYEMHRKKTHPVRCAFCGNLISEERLRKLGEYFNDVIRELVKEIEEVVSIIDNTYQRETLSLPLEKEQLYNEFQGEFLDLKDQFARNVNLIRQELNNLRKKLLAKKNNPSHEATFSFGNIDKAKSNIENIVVRINELIKKHNEKTDSFKEKRAEAAHKLELAIISKYNDDYIEKINECRDMSQSIELLDDEVAELEIKQKDLEQKLRDHHFAAEEFNKLLKSFLGRDEIVLETVEGGYVIKRNGRIANNLSEGEKNAIALIYFLIKLKEENFNLRNGIVVIDDPVSSFDSQNLYNAFGFIKEKIKKLGPKQVFILTHNFPFFRLLRGWMEHEKKKERCTLYMIRSKIEPNEHRYSIIDELDELLRDHNSEYTYLFKIIYERANTQNSSMEKDYILPNLIRKFLENYISFKVPIGGMQIHKKLDELYKDHPTISIETKTRIEKYCQDQSHPLYQDSPTDFDELLLGEIQSICSDVVELVRETDPEHFRHLVDEINKSRNKKTEK